MSFSPFRRTAFCGASALGLALGSVLFAAPASAHVTVNPGEAESGGFSKLTFRVPNESDSAGTTQVAFAFPPDSPLAFVSVKPHAGWDVQVERETFDEPVTVGDFELTDAVTRVTWTAQPGIRIGPGEFDEFEVSVGPLPDEEELLFPATQTYDDGETVEWDEPVPAGGEEPEHPAPTLTLTAGDGVGDHGGEGTDDGTGVEEAAAGTDVDQAADDGGSDGTARTLGVAGLTVGVIGLGVGAVALRSTRRTRP